MCSFSCGTRSLAVSLLHKKTFELRKDISGTLSELSLHYNTFTMLHMYNHFGGVGAGTVQSGQYNLPESAAKAGAKVAIGWEEVQYGIQPEWIKSFVMKLN